jgi:hypothetical protein
MRSVIAVVLASCSFEPPAAVMDMGSDGGPVLDGQAGDASTTTDAQISFVIQAEDATRSSAPAGSAWVVATTPLDFTGTGSMTLQPNTVACADPLVGTCATLEFDIMIVEERTYHAFARMYASNGSEDSIHWALDDQATRVLDTNETQPAWRWDGSLSLLLAPGLHTLRIWNRNSNLHVDAVALMPANMPPP